MRGFSQALYPYVLVTIILAASVVSTRSLRLLKTRKMAQEADLKRGRSQMEAEGSKLSHLYGLMPTSAVPSPTYWRCAIPCCPENLVLY